VKKSGDGFTVVTAEGGDSFAAVIICCGGKAGGKVGGTALGYELLKSLGHHCTPLYPALVQIKTDTAFVRSLKGVRADADIRLIRRGEVITRSAGEVQFTDFGVSGPAVFEISRAASLSGAGTEVTLDFLRDVSREDVKKLIGERIASMPSLTLENLLTGMVHNRLGRMVLKYVGYDINSPVTSLTEEDAVKIAAAVKSFTLPVTGTLGFDDAQVTVGGIKTDEFDVKTMESRLVPGLYAAGEVLDVDGECGGFNLQWAWSSGHLAGRLGGRKA